jgi:SPX domain protein involved in polyphosphate accumulation
MSSRSEDEANPLLRLNRETVGQLSPRRYRPIYQLENEIMRLLRTELAKTEGTIPAHFAQCLQQDPQGFFTNQVHAFEIRIEHLKEEAEQLKYMKQTEVATKHREIAKAEKVLERSLTQVYRHLMMLENFAQLNYTAFSKVALSWAISEDT